MSKNNIPEIILERYVLKELPEEKMKEVEEYLIKNPYAKRRVEEIELANAEILRNYPAEEIAVEINRRLAVSEKRQKNIKADKVKRLYLPSFAIAAAAVILIVIFPLVRPVDDLLKNNNGVEITRAKGENAGLLVYRKRGSRVELLKSGAEARKGDLLQIAYFSIEDGYGTVLSIDGRGTVTLHFPGDADSSTALKKGKKSLLPNAYELDDAPEFERFFFITGKSELDVRRLLSAAKALSVIPGLAMIEDLKIDKSLNQESVLIEKEEQL